MISGALDDGDVEYLLDRPIDAEPFGTHAVGQIDDLDTAPRLTVGVFQPLVERETFKAFVARFG